MKMNTIDPNNVSLKEMIERGIDFHGHLGPFLVLGIRMGLVGLREMGSLGYENIMVEAKTGTTPPLSCLVDGLQISTGCTLGKGNIITEPLGRAEATFLKDGHSLTLRVCQPVLDQIQSLSPDQIEEFAWKVSLEPESSILERA